MRWFGASNSLRVLDGKEELIFLIESKRRLIDFVIPVSLIVLFTFGMYRRGSPYALIYGAVLAAVLTLNWFSVKRWTLTVSEVEVRATSGSSFSKDSRRLAWSEIGRLEYSAGGEDGPSGLYARQGLGRGSWLLTGIDRQTTEEIVHSIYQKYPFAGSPEKADDYVSIFGKGSEPITLGLSDPGSIKLD